MNIMYIAGSSDDFLGLYQMTGEFMAGFTGKMAGWEKHGTLMQARIRSLCGYYLATSNESASANYWSGEPTIIDYMIPGPKVDFPAI